MRRRQPSKSLRTWADGLRLAVRRRSEQITYWGTYFECSSHGGSNRHWIRNAFRLPGCVTAADPLDEGDQWELLAKKIRVEHQRDRERWLAGGSRLGPIAYVEWEDRGVKIGEYRSEILGPSLPSGSGVIPPES